MPSRTPRPAARTVKGSGVTYRRVGIADDGRKAGNGAVERATQRCPLPATRVLFPRRDAPPHQLEPCPVLRESPRRRLRNHCNPERVGPRDAATTGAKVVLNSENGRNVAWLAEQALTPQTRRVDVPGFRSKLRGSVPVDVEPVG
jgi:hypothetical protein